MKKLPWWVPRRFASWVQSVSSPSFTHYTTRSTLLQIVMSETFFLIANKRHLLNQFLDTASFGTNEPTVYGFLSLTRLPIANARLVRERFGHFGIGMSEEWSMRNRAQPVIYVHSEGPAFQSFKLLFEGAWVDYLKQRGEPEPWDMSTVHRGIAGTFQGGHGWAEMLRLYEYMQPVAHEGREYYGEQEWRIVNERPAGFNARDRDEMIEEAAAQLKTWRLHDAAFGPGDVDFLVGPPGELKALRRALPAKFRRVRLLRAM